MPKMAGVLRSRAGMVEALDLVEDRLHLDAIVVLDAVD
jgi:hypothetical protein